MPVKKTHPFKKKALWVIVVVILLAGGALFAYFHHRKTVTVIPTTSKHTTNVKVTGVPNQPAAAQATSPAASSAKVNPPAAPSGNGPAAPTGPFVSNHSPGQNGSPLSEASVCNTSPGASCYIEFINGNSTKKLPAQTTDNTGAAYWSWNINDAGLSSGTWKITAIATLNGQTSSASDSANLEVQ